MKRKLNEFKNRNSSFDFTSLQFGVFVLVTVHRTCKQRKEALDLADVELLLLLRNPHEEPTHFTELIVEWGKKA